MSRNRARSWSGAVAAALVLATCTQGESGGPCVLDSDCPLGQKCLDGACVNPPPACNDNTGCEAGTFCDSFRGQCLREGTCARDLHCPFGQVCDRNRCVEGCRTNADCALGVACARTQGSPLGVCQEGVCAEDADCCWGEVCQRGQCIRVTNQPYCAPCEVSEQCGRGANFCLINPVEGRGSAEYCGIDCSADGRCPNGYSCGSINTIRAECRTDADCMQFGVQCIKSPEQDRGFCPCRVDADCPHALNVCLFGTCAVTRKSCRTTVDCQAQPIKCDAQGACIIGQNCAPDAGLVCADILEGGGGPPAEVSGRRCGPQPAGP